MAEVRVRGFLHWSGPGGRVSKPETHNRLLQDLATTDPTAFKRLLRDLERTPLEAGALLTPARRRTAWVYFVDSGIISLVAGTRHGQSLEVAIVGREGVAGFADAMGGLGLPYRLIVQLPGLAYRVRTGVIEKHIYSCTAMHDLLMTYSQVLMHQLSQSALCSRFHSSVQRLARWLLLTAERAGTVRLPLTHDVIAQMVGAPRSAVTQAAAELRSAGIIAYQRGLITVRSIPRLHKRACECFDAVAVPMRAVSRARAR
jgi:CRP-like cAMP-binding protein